jgi:cytochrome c peroxidase
VVRAAALAFVIVSVAQPVVGLAAEPYQWRLPRGFPTPAVPADNAMSDAKVALGRRLFFEPRLSVTGKYSCASCHEPAKAFTDGRGLAIGATGEQTPNGAMSLTNVAYNISFGWSHGEVRSLEQQMLQPLLNEHPVELGLKGRESQVVGVLLSDERYREPFDEAFPEAHGKIEFQHVVKSIAAFERTLVSGNSAFDRYVFGGEHRALTAEAKRGMALFYSDRVGCGGCHSGFNFSGTWRDAQGDAEPSFALNGLGPEPTRVPTLRNIGLTAPYMHDGRFSTLEAVLDHYQRAGARAGATTNEQEINRLRPFILNETERRELIAFLQSLTDPTFRAGFDVERTDFISRR